MVSALNDATCSPAQNEMLARSQMPAQASAMHPAPARVASFHPLDSGVLATTAGGTTLVWFLEPLWNRSVFRAQPLSPGCLPEGHQATTHAWCPAGLLVGSGAGALTLVDLTSLAPLAPPENTGSEPGSAPCVLADAAGPGAGVSSLALNRDFVAVGGSDGSVHVFSLPSLAGGQGPLSFSHEVRLGRAGTTGVPVASLDCGGPAHGTLLLGCPDGTLLRAPLAPHAGAHTAARAGYTVAAPLLDCHVGRIACIVPHPGGGAFVSAGADGSVRVWSASDGCLVARKAFSSAQSALAAANPGVALVAVGGDTGVVRLLALPPAAAAASPQDAPQPLRVLFRRRLHAGAVDGLVFSPDNSLLASAGRDGCLWLTAVDWRSGTARALGWVALPPGERALSMVWPRTAEPGSEEPGLEEDSSCLVSLSSGGLLCLTVSPELHSGNWRNAAPDLALLRPPAPGNGRSLGSDSGEAGPGGPSPAEHVTAKLLRLEVPLLSVVAVPGDRCGGEGRLGGRPRVARAEGGTAH
jgi:WD40 repeat protein